MKIKEKFPLIVFDNKCYLCIKFAKAVNFLARGRITLIGHYSELGEKIRNEILDETALEMFWFIDKKGARGGRAAILPLIKTMISEKKKKSPTRIIDENCQQECKTVKAVFVRSASLITNSRKIDF